MIKTTAEDAEDAEDRGERKMDVEAAAAAASTSCFFLRASPRPPRCVLIRHRGQYALRMRWLWLVAKGLEGVGMIVVLVGLVLSIQLGFQDESLESMRYEGMALLGGGALFVAGWMLERRLGTR